MRCERFDTHLIQCNQLNLRMLCITIIAYYYLGKETGLYLFGMEDIVLWVQNESPFFIRVTMPVYLCQNHAETIDFNCWLQI